MSWQRGKVVILISENENTGVIVSHGLGAQGEAGSGGRLTEQM